MTLKVKSQGPPENTKRSFRKMNPAEELCNSQLLDPNMSSILLLTQLTAAEADGKRYNPICKSYDTHMRKQSRADEYM